MDTVETFSEPAWKTDLSEKESGWSGWINYTAMQRALSAHGRGTLQRWMERWRCCFLAGPCCLVPAALGHGSTKLSKGIQFTVKQGGRSCSFSLPILTLLFGAPLYLLVDGTERKSGSWELILALATSCFVGSAAQESTSLRHPGSCLQASFQSTRTFWSTPDSLPCCFLGTVEI